MLTLFWFRLWYRIADAVPVYSPYVASLRRYPPSMIANPKRPVKAEVRTQIGV
jgi:hypothetical protein